MNLRGAELARQAADEAGGRFVAGSVGPMNVTLSLSPRVEDPAYRAVSFDQVRAAYAEQIRALADGGVDLLLIETIFDTLNAKAAIAAAREVAPHLPLWISVTIVDRSGRTLSGQTVEAFWTAVEHAEPAGGRRQLLAGRRGDAPLRRRAVPAGRHLHRLPPERRPAQRVRRLRPGAAETSRLLGDYAAAGLVNIVGGCCGTTPEHIARDRGGRGRDAAAPGCPAAAPRPVQRPGDLRHRPGHRLRDDRRAHQRHRLAPVPPADRGRRPPGARSTVALEQVRGGANLLDVNMDADLLDSEQAMTTFLNLIATEPEVARIPVMIDSSRWSVLRGRAEVRAGQGRGQLDQPQGGRGAVPGSGPADPRATAPGVVVMAFDEQGQADTAERKVAICGRAYDLLTQQAGFAARGHHLRPQRARRGHRHRRAQRLRRRRSSTRCR